MEEGDVIDLVLEGGARLDKALAAAMPAALGLSRSRVQALIAGGAVTRAGAPLTDPSAKALPGPVTVTLPPPEMTEAVAEAIPLTILYEDTDLLVVDKPAGMVVHPAPGAERGTLVNALLHHVGDALSKVGATGRPGIVHRIDKDTSGLLVVALTERALSGLAAQFAAHSVERVYEALTSGVPERSPRIAGLSGVDFEGSVIRVDAPIGRHRTDRKRMAVVPSGRRAVTRIELRERLDGSARIACRLETGRTHQIRVHCSYLGHPLLNDPVYGRGRRRIQGPVGQALHAGVLGFDHPVGGRRLRFEAPPPAAFTQALHAVRQGDLKRE